ncbi:hypothetical protein ACU610_02760 [Geodermatophilus sp. URMC 61]|uniref:hypothetical protein n=1 Tax=Geodermatophilus sp. URMC 61 TaxID=3423411 RepID=UPI00406C27DD
MTEVSAPASPTTWHLARRSRIRAFRAGPFILILAEGQLPNPGYEVDIQRSPLLIFPPQFNLLWRQRPGIWPTVVVPYRHCEVFRYPVDQPTVTVHHADGQDQVEIQPIGAELAQFGAMVSDRSTDEGSAPGGEEAIGMSANLKFDEAFANALDNLPPFDPPYPDALARVDVVDTAGLFGGLPGFHHLVVRVRRVVT